MDDAFKVSRLESKFDKQFVAMGKKKRKKKRVNVLYMGERGLV